MTYTREIMRILISIGSLGLGGAEKQAVWLANKLSEFHEVTLLTYHGGARERDLSAKVKWETIFPRAIIEQEVDESLISNSDTAPTTKFQQRHRQKNPSLALKVARRIKRVIHQPTRQARRLLQRVKRIPSRIRYLVKTRIIDRAVLKYRNYTFVFFTARRVIDRSDPEVVITFLFHDTLNIGLASSLRRKKTKLIVGRRSPAGYGDKSRPLVHRLILRFIYWHADLAVSNSKANLENAIKDGLKSEKIVLIPNYVEMGRLKPINSQPHVPIKIICVANFLWYKNHSGLLSAISSIPYHEKRFQFIFVGDGPLLEDIRSTAANLKINCVFKGFIQDPREVIESCDVMILVSYFEGSSNALLEGLALGIPAISSATGSAIELKEMGGPLLICDPNSKESMAKSLMQLEEHFGELSIAAQEFSHKIEEIYGEKTVLESWEKAISTD